MDLAYSITLGLLGFAFSSLMDRIGIPSGFTLAYLSVIYISRMHHIRFAFRLSCTSLTSKSSGPKSFVSHRRRGGRRRRGLVSGGRGDEGGGECGAGGGRGGGLWRSVRLSLSLLLATACPSCVPPTSWHARRRPAVIGSCDGQAGPSQVPTTSGLSGWSPCQEILRTACWPS